MVTIDNPTILLTRGNSLSAVVRLKNPDGTYYTPQEGDSVAFAMKTPRMDMKRSAYVDDEPVLEITVPIDTMLLVLEPDDTEELGFGRYMYDIKLTYANGKVDTPINNAEFWILPEVD